MIGPRWRTWLAIWVVVGVSVAPLGCGTDEPVVPPVVISLEPPVDYPLELWDLGVEGTVVVMVHVTAVGAVDSVFVQTSSGRPLFDSAAVAGAYDLRFAPGRQGDERVAAWVELPIQFRKSVVLGESE